MAITSTGLNAATHSEAVTSKEIANKTKLGKDDFMTLLLVELQHQDPTEPMDSEKILTQTSQLASLESTDKTNKALSDLSASLGNTQQFSTIAAIGKTANLGSDTIALGESGISSFELYFASDVKEGSVNIKDSDGNKIATIDVKETAAGVHKFDWDGTDLNGNVVKEGIYKVDAEYTNNAGESLETKLGVYPIESVRFQEGETLVKVGSTYVPLSKVFEVY